MENLVRKYQMDCNEIDINGKNCLAIIYEELAALPESAPAAGFIDSLIGKPLDYEPLKLLF